MIDLNDHERQRISDLVARHGVDEATRIIMDATRRPSDTDEGKFIGKARSALLVPHGCRPERNQAMQGWSCIDCGKFLCGDEQVERLVR